MRGYRNPFEEQRDEPLATSLVTAGFEERGFQAGAVNINYVIGPDNGQPLVLIPAQMATWETYAPILPDLSRHFQLYALDVRGHGKSSWTPGDYSWRSIGGDMTAFLTGVVGRPAILSGNSSGGLVALWCAANLPEWTRAIVLEDAPVFSAEMPRFKERDRYVYNGLVHAVEILGDLEHRRLADYFRGQELPVSERRVKRIPDWLIGFLDTRVRRYEAKHPGRPSGIDGWYFPKSFGQLFRSLSMFDPDFARAFVDGRFYEGLDHAEALRRTHCPILLLHATWHRFERYGLVGALDDDDARRVQELAPQTRYIAIPANHVIHRYKSTEFLRALTEFAASID